MAKFKNDGDKGAAEAPFARRPGPMQPKRITEPRCSICSSPSRDVIERQLVLGMTQVDVMAIMEDRGEKFSARAMSNHKRKHMTLSDDVTRRALERKAMQLNGEIEDLAGYIINTDAILDIMRTQSFKRIVDDTMDYTPGDVFNLLDRIDKIEAATKQASIDNMMRDLNALLAAIKEFAKPGDWDHIVARWEFHRSRMDGHMKGVVDDAKTKVLEAKVVEPKKKAKAVKKKDLP